MKILKIGLLTALLAGCSSEPKNFAECILGDMPGVGNESARSVVYRKCKTDFPEMMYEIKKGSGLGFLSDIKSRDECVVKNNKMTLNQNAAININIACSCLYEKPRFKDEICAYEQPNYSELVRVK